MARLTCRAAQVAQGGARWGTCRYASRVLAAHRVKVRVAIGGHEALLDPARSRSGRRSGCSRSGRRGGWADAKSRRRSGAWSGRAEAAGADAGVGERMERERTQECTLTPGWQGMQVEEGKKRMRKVESALWGGQGATQGGNSRKKTQGGSKGRANSRRRKGSVRRGSRSHRTRSRRAHR